MIHFNTFLKFAFFIIAYEMKQSLFFKKCKKNISIIFLIAIIFSNFHHCYGKENMNKLNYKLPSAKKIEHIMTNHGVSRVDNYFWMNQRDSPDVLEYLNQENAYTEQVLSNYKEQTEALFNELKGRIKENDASAPIKIRNYFYYLRYEEGKQYPIHCRKFEKLTANEDIILDVNTLAENQKYCSVAGLSVSPDTKILSYCTDFVSRRQYTIHFKNLENEKEVYQDKIENTNGYAVWANDNKTVFYTRKDELTLRSYQVFMHILGTDSKHDKLIYQESDETFEISLSKSKSRKYIFISSSSTLSDEVRLIDADNPENESVVFHARERDLEYDIDHAGDLFYIRTNFHALNFRLMACKQAGTDKSKWREVISHNKNIFLEDFEIFKNYLVLNERSNALNQIRVINTQNGEENSIKFNDEAYSVYLGANPEFESDRLRYIYSSLTTPKTSFDYVFAEKDFEIIKEESVLGNFNKNNYESKRIFVNARDGKKIPMSLVYRKGLKLDGTNPCLQYGYGSYGISEDADFSANIISLLDRGFVYALVHIRGGQDLGREWYDDGKLLKKKNTFYDFTDCSKYLIQHKYSSSDKLFAKGGSAGGLLMGAVVNMEPKLYKGIIALVPFVDVVTTMLDESIPLTTGEYDEWGNPNEKKYFDYMLSYSPYDNIEKKEYPSMFVATGYHDSQVQYWEPAKWVAKLRELKTDDNILLFDCNMSTGHGGASGRFERYKLTAKIYTFMLNLLD